MPASLKGYLILFAVLLLLLAGIWFDLHVRSEQKNADIAHAEAQVTRVIQKDAVISEKAQTEVSSAVQIYKQVVQLPAVPDIGVVCQRPGNPAVPAPAAGDSAGHAGAEQRAPDLRDPSGDLLTVGRSSDALVRYLQVENAALRAEMTAVSKVHR